MGKHWYDVKPFLCGEYHREQCEVGMIVLINDIILFSRALIVIIFRSVAVHKTTPLGTILPIY